MAQETEASDESLKTENMLERNSLDNSEIYGPASFSDENQESEASDESPRTLNMSESLS